jgi:acid phosphatase type 7
MSMNRSLSISWCFGPLIVLLFSLLFAQSSAEERYNPLALYLTWQQDPTSTMVIHWHTNWKDGYRDPALQYRKKGETDWKVDIGTWIPMPFSEERLIHTVELTGLHPGSVYEFRLGKIVADDSAPFSLTEGGFSFIPDSEVYTFRTMPRDVQEPIVFVAGADTHGPQHIERYIHMSEQAARANPYFAVIAGDIAYAEGNPERIGYWYAFFDVWMEKMVTEDGHLIPIIPTLGNHDEHGDEYDQRGGRSNPNRAPFLTTLFATPGKRGYTVLDFGEYLSLVLLDSHHTNTIYGEQAAWLEGVLEERRNIKNVFPVYHVQAYSAARDFDRPVESLIREHWVPLFENYGIRVAFEGHDHTFKRTHPIKDNRVDAAGVVYLNSAWGANPRRPHDPEETWFLKKAVSINSVFVVQLEEASVTVSTLSVDGDIIDEMKIDNR